MLTPVSKLRRGGGRRRSHSPGAASATRRDGAVAGPILPPSTPGPVKSCRRGGGEPAGAAGLLEGGARGPEVLTPRSVRCGGHRNHGVDRPTARSRDVACGRRQCGAGRQRQRARGGPGRATGYWRHPRPPAAAVQTEETAPWDTDPAAVVRCIRDAQQRRSGEIWRSGVRRSNGRERAGHPGGTGPTRPKAATPPQRGWSPRPRSPRSGIGFIAALGAATAGVNTAPNGDVIWAKEPPNKGDPGSAARRIRIVHGAPVDSRRLGAWPSSAQGGCPPKVLTAPGQAPDQVLTPHKTGTPPDSPVADKPSGRLRTFPLD